MARDRGNLGYADVRLMAVPSRDSHTSRVAASCFLCSSKIHSVSMAEIEVEGTSDSNGCHPLSLWSNVRKQRLYVRYVECGGGLGQVTAKVLIMYIESGEGKVKICFAQGWLD